MIKKKTRDELYNRFRQGSIPTGADFGDLIRSNLNLLDDGIDIPDNPDEPVIFRGRGEDQNLIDIADSKGTKKWRLSGLSLKRDSEGLNIKSDNRDRVFIARETGNTGLGTDSPEARLHIKQTGSEDAFRVDDENSDTTPFVITSEGNVGIGKGGGDEKPLAKLHINNGNSPADAFRVDDADDDTTPFVINCDGKIGIGCEDNPLSGLTVGTGVAIGENKFVAAGSLNVSGNISLGGKLILTSESGQNGMDINGPLRSQNDRKITLMGDVEIIDDNNNGLSCDFSVQGNASVGLAGSGKSLTVDGNISSGGDLTVSGTSILGNGYDDIIYLNGTIQRTNIVTGADPIKINDYVEVVNRLSAGGLTSTITDQSLPPITVSSSGLVPNLNCDMVDSLHADSSPVSDTNTLVTKSAVKTYVDNKFPIGTIWMYDGMGWVDNSTLPGWYACITANSGVGCPNLADRFILGGTAAQIKQTGGSFSKTISSSNLPRHTHSINHAHGSTYGEIQTHSHGKGDLSGYYMGKEDDCSHSGYVGALMYTYCSMGVQSSNGGIVITGNTAEVSQWHSHTIPAFSGNSQDGNFSNASLEITPPYYRVLFIRRCS